jgi:hypothetical protein
MLPGEDQGFACVHGLGKDVFGRRVTCDETDDGQRKSFAFIYPCKLCSRIEDGLYFLLDA